MGYSARVRSVSLDARELDHLRPLLGFVRDELTEFRGRQWQHCPSQECGSVGALAEELARRNIVSKVRAFATGRAKGSGPYGMGALAHFLKNRFYIGEVVYRREVFVGFGPQVSAASLKAMRQRIRELKLRKRTHVRLADIARTLRMPPRRRLRVSTKASDSSVRKRMLTSIMESCSA
jgi:hypothetical protein